MELFNDLNGEKINKFAKKRIIDFINDKDVTKEQLMDIGLKFPAKALINLIRSNILNEIA